MTTTNFANFSEVFMQEPTTIVETWLCCCFTSCIKIIGFLFLFIQITHVVYLRCVGGEVGATSSLAPKIGPLGLVSILFLLVSYWKSCKLLFLYILPGKHVNTCLTISAMQIRIPIELICYFMFISFTVAKENR